MKVLPHALLIGNGPEVPPQLLQAEAAKAQLLIAADGGADTALNAGLMPDVVIGDLDSVSTQAKRKLSCAQWIFVDNQNNTDLEKALDYLLSLRCKCCTLIGFSSGRMDFTLGNLLATSRYVNKMELCVIGNGWKIYPIHKRKTFETRPGARVSLLPISRCHGVSLQGLKYPLQQASLTLGTTRTLSNQAVKNRFTVSLRQGKLLVYLED